MKCKSTGEVAYLGDNFYEAIVKALESAEFDISKNAGSVLLYASDTYIEKLIPLMTDLYRMGSRIYTNKTLAETLEKRGIHDETVIHKVHEMDKNRNPIR